jgi:agmatine deiminase
MQEEHSVHFRTWMGYPVYANKLDLLYTVAIIDAQREHVVRVAKTIAKYEPVCIIVDSEADGQIASEQLVNVNVDSKYDISLIIHPIDDLWLRDSGPIFVKDVRDSNNKPVAIDFNFNGWGNKIYCVNDSKIAGFIGNYSNAKVVKASLVLEGGAIEVDGKGTAILAESSILNDNRNPNKLKEDVEKELGRLLGIRKIIWVPGVRSKTLCDDLTDYHIDLYARFAGSHLPGHVFVNIDNEHPSTYENLSIIQNATDANGQKLIPIVLNAPNYQNVTTKLD